MRGVETARRRRTIAIPAPSQGSSDGTHSGGARTTRTPAGSPGRRSEISAAIQHRHAVAVPDGSLEAAGTLGDVVDLVNRLLGAGLQSTEPDPPAAGGAMAAVDPHRDEAR